MLPKVDNVVIPDDVAIPCPKMEFQNVWVSKRCTECDSFEGICQKGQNGIWQADYAILCGGIVERNVFVPTKVVED